VPVEYELSEILDFHRACPDGVTTGGYHRCARESIRSWSRHRLDDGGTKGDRDGEAAYW
jgi:hypothetical protein